MAFYQLLDTLRIDRFVFFNHCVISFLYHIENVLPKELLSQLLDHHLTHSVYAFALNENKVFVAGPSKHYLWLSMQLPESVFLIFERGH